MYVDHHVKNAAKNYSKTHCRRRSALQCGLVTAKVFPMRAGIKLGITAVLDVNPGACKPDWWIV